jgi:hypothetical protein
MSHANGPPIPLRGRGEILDRLEVAAAENLLLVEAPPVIQEILAGALDPRQTLVSVEARAIRSVKGRFDWILLWQESRVGSRAVFDAALKRLEPEGRLWVVTALRKVQGPRTPSAHRLEPSDLAKAFEKAGLANDREARLSAWHAALRFTRRPKVREDYST